MAVWISCPATSRPSQLPIEPCRANNGTADALSQVPISHSWETIQSLLEGAIVSTANRSEVRVSEELLEKHKHLSHEARV